MKHSALKALILISTVCGQAAYGGIFPDVSSFDINGNYSGWVVSGNVTKVMTPVYGGTGQSVKISNQGWSYKFFGSTAKISAVTVWLYEPSTNRTSYTGENRSVNILLQQNGASTGPYLTVLTQNNTRYLACFQNDVSSTIAAIPENQFTEIKVELLGDVSNQKYVVYCNGTKFDNSGQGYRFNKSCSRIDQVMFSDTNVNNGVYTVLDQITVNGSGGPTGLPIWNFDNSSDPDDKWLNYDSASLLRSLGKLEVSIATGKSFGIIATQVNPFDAAAKSVLTLDVNCPGQESITLYWKNSESTTYVGVPIALKNGRSDPCERIDLRSEEAWAGSITNIGLGFGTYGTEHLSINSFEINDNTAEIGFARAKWMGFKNAINRPSKAATLSLVLKNVSATAIAASTMTFACDPNYLSPVAPLPIPAIGIDQEIAVETQVLPIAQGNVVLTCYYNGQKFTKKLRIDEQIEPTIPGIYSVPQPVPVSSNYNIGTFYFPGWSNEVNNWLSYDYLGLEPVIGKYIEGQPEISDWQIKFAVENGINFFIFDWYWQYGTERLGAALRDGFMRAHYKNMMKFCLLLTNHPPFAGNTNAELAQITDFWLANYLRDPSYLTINGKPVVLFWSLYSLQVGLGNGVQASSATVAAALNTMRQKCIDAGLPGLYIGLCMQDEHSSSAMQTFKDCGFDFVTDYAYGDTGQVLDQSPYHEFVIKHTSKWQEIQQAKAGLNLLDMPVLTPGYDRRPWKGPTGLRRFEHDSAYFAEALALLKAHMDSTGKTFCILGDWNEFGEGCYLEPTNEVGFGDLEAIRQTFAVPGSWPVNIAPSDLEWPYLQPFAKKEVLILNTGFENDPAAMAFTAAYDNDPAAPAWTVQESGSPDQLLVFCTETSGASTQWVKSGSHALRFKIISDPMSFRPSIATSLKNKTTVRWSFWMYAPSNQAVSSSTRAFDFVIKGIKTSDHSTEDRASLVSLYYTDPATAQIKLYSPLHGGWQSPVEISTDQYHFIELEARTFPDGNAWFLRIDGQSYDNNGDGWSMFNGVDYFTSAEIRGGELAGPVIYVDDFSTSWVPQYWFGDINKDNVTDLQDVSELAAHWLAQPCNSGNNWCDNSDCNKDGSIDLVDLAILAQNWLH